MSPPRLLPVLAALAGLAWPIVIARSTQVVVGVTDALLVGHLGEGALAATTGGALNAYALLVLPVGVAGIVSAFASQLSGAGEGARARRYAMYGLAVAAATQLAVLALFPALPWLLARFDYVPEVQALMAGYLRVRLLSAGATVGLDALAGYYAGTGNTRLPMLASAAALVLNVAGNWLLIDGHLGLPAMGVAGSALASTLATTLAFAGLLCAFLLDRARSQGRSAAGALSARELGRMLRLGLPVGAHALLEAFAFVYFVDVVVAGFGTTTLAAFMTVLQISSFATLPAYAFASAGAVLAGQAIGRGARDDVPRLAAITLGVAAGWQAILALAYVFGGRALLLSFAPAVPEAQAFVEAGTPLLLLSVVWTLFEAMSAIYAEVLSAAGDTAVALWVRAAVLGGVLAPGAWVLVHELRSGCTGVVLWFAGASALVAGALHTRFQRGAWRRIHLTRPPSEGLCHATP